MLEYTLPLTHVTIPETNISYSDHEAVATKLLIKSNDHDISNSKDASSSKFEKINGVSYSETLAEGIQVLDHILKRLRSDKNFYLVNEIKKYCRIRTSLHDSFFLVIADDGSSLDNSAVFPD